MDKNTHTFEEWFAEVKRETQKGYPIWLIGSPDPNEPEECNPMSDKELEIWAEENYKYFLQYYNDGLTTDRARFEFVI